MEGQRTMGEKEKEREREEVIEKLGVMRERDTINRAIQ